MNNTSKLQQLAGQAIRLWFKDVEVLENYRPAWLNGMELDFFIPSLMISIEVQGKQHYLWCPELQPSIHHFRAQRARDCLKRKIGRQHNVRGFVIKGEKSSLESTRRKIRLLLGVKVPGTPIELRKEWRSHCKYLRSRPWPAFKARHGSFIPTNASSAESTVWRNRKAQMAIARNGGIDDRARPSIGS